MADTAHRLTDEKLEEMEKRLSAIYSRAEKEIQKTADEYFPKFAKQDEAKAETYHRSIPQACKHYMKPWKQTATSGVSYSSTISWQEQLVIRWMRMVPLLFLEHRKQ